MKILKKIAKIARRLGLSRGRSAKWVHDEAFVSLRPPGESRGHVLLGYMVEAFLPQFEELMGTHTNYWETRAMAQTFLDLGYSVDVISYRNGAFVPRKSYELYVATRTSFQRIAQLLGPECLRIAHMDTAHWLFNNSATYRRALELQERRGVSLRSFKWVEPNWALEAADCATVLGNEFTLGTFRYAGKPLYPLPVPTVTFPWPDGKDFEKCRRRYLWFGSDGLVHKGLDLALEAFAGMPEHHLTVCGPIEKDRDFVAAFRRELYETPNIRVEGWVDIASPRFTGIARECLGFVYPSCSEGQSGGAVTCLQAALIPIISHQSGVDVDDFGVILRDCGVDAIRAAAREISGLSVQELEARARKTWNAARSRNSREAYAEEYRRVIAAIRESHGRGR